MEQNINNKVTENSVADSLYSVSSAKDFFKKTKDTSLNFNDFDYKSSNIVNIIVVKGEPNWDVNGKIVSPTLEGYLIDIRRIISVYILCGRDPNSGRKIPLSQCNERDITERKDKGRRCEDIPGHTHNKYGDPNT